MFPYVLNVWPKLDREKPKSLLHNSRVPWLMITPTSLDTIIYRYLNNKNNVCEGLLRQVSGLYVSVFRQLKNYWKEGQWSFYQLKQRKGRRNDDFFLRFVEIFSRARHMKLRVEYSCWHKMFLICLYRLTSHFSRFVLSHSEPTHRPRVDKV